MFKFIKQYAETIDNINIYPIVSLFIFLVFFVVLLVWVKKMRKEEVNEMANIPFQKEELTNSTL
jgi:cytochrome c oxidase cbb3-type subunit IV